MPTNLNRRRILKGAAAMGAYALSGHSRGATSKPFEGVELNVSCWSAPFPKLLQGYLPEFEQLTGIKVNYDTPGFLIYNQRVDLELSTKGSSYDVLNITFIYVDRWLRAGWFTPLNDFLKDESATPKGWDVDDFLPATRKIMSDKDRTPVRHSLDGRRLDGRRRTLRSRHAGRSRDAAARSTTSRRSPPRPTRTGCRAFSATTATAGISRRTCRASAATSFVARRTT